MKDITQKIKNKEEEVNLQAAPEHPHENIKEEVNFIKVHSRAFIAHLGLLVLEYSKWDF